MFDKNILTTLYTTLDINQNPALQGFCYVWLLHLFLWFHMLSLLLWKMQHLEWKECIRFHLKREDLFQGVMEFLIKEK